MTLMKMTSPGKQIKNMSATTLSNMSDPDILLTIQAYTFMKVKLNERLILIQEHDDYLKDNIDNCRIKIARIDQLVNALLNEWTKRENS